MQKTVVLNEDLLYLEQACPYLIRIVFVVAYCKCQLHYFAICVGKSKKNE